MFPLYQQHYMTQSDIQHHLGLLFSSARGNVLELGTRSGVSTAALLAGVERHGGHVWSVDLDANCINLFEHPQWTFTCGDSCDPEIAEFLSIRGERECFDLIFIDTTHQYEITQAELALWGPHLKPGGTILLHDTETFPGVRRAAQEFADAHGWDSTFVLPCHGMGILVSPE